MQLLIKNGKVFATHTNEQRVAHLYPDCECVFWEDDIMPNSDDPRSLAQKLEAYRDKRRVEYPSIKDQLEMLYDDKIKGTTTWVDAITAVKVKYPKPSEDTQ